MLTDWERDKNRIEFFVPYANMALLGTKEHSQAIDDGGFTWSTLSTSSNACIGKF